MRFDNEKELECLLCDYMHDYGVCRVTGEDVESYRTQLKLGPYGICDIVTLNGLRSERNAVVNCIELKVSELHVDHIAQIARYRKGFERNFKKHAKVWVKFKYTLVCKNPCEDAEVMWLAEAQRGWLDIYLYDVDLDGVSFTLFNTGERRYFDEELIPVNRDIQEIGRYYRDDYYTHEALREMGRVD